MPNQSAGQARLWYALTALIVLGGLFYWQRDLTSDPPMYYAGLGQSLFTDPPQYVFHARNYHLFGSSDPFDYPKFAVFQNSLVSRIAYLWFSIAGVSMTEANRIGVFANIAGLVFMLLGLYRHHRPWVIAAVAFCWVINLSLMVHARLPYLENGLIFSSGLLFWLYSWWGDRTWGITLCGVVIALATWMGKLFGVLLLPAVALAIVSSDTPHRWRQIFKAAGAFAVSSLALILLMYSGRMSAVSGYFGEQTYGLYGFPPGLSSPLKFVEYLVSYGYTNRLSYRNPDVIGFLALAGALLARLLAAKETAFRQLSRPTLLSLFWVVCLVGGLMPLGYSPMRYAVTVVPAVIALCFLMFDTSMNLRPNQQYRYFWLPTAILAFSFWVFLFHLVGDTMFYNVVPPKLRLITWSTVLPAASFAFLVIWLAGKTRRRLNQRALMSLLVVTLVVATIVNVARTRRSIWLEQNITIREANRDVAQILGPGAIVSGPYGPTVTEDTRLGSFIHHFGVAKVDSALFDRYPVTHIAIDVSNAAVALKNYPVMTAASPVALFWICDNQVQLYNISKQFNNPRARQYVETSYERASSLSMQNKPDSALAELRPFIRSHPDSRAAGLLNAKLLAQLGRLKDAATAYSTQAQRFPNDFGSLLECGYFFLQMARANSDRNLLATAEQYFYRATVVDPYQADFTADLWARTLNQPGQNMPQP
ncbi:MAG: hypothetical protein AB1644_06605 [Candidatus Zixiibacteriota bacterium]